jgi:rsbT co-antagonist protein RsbR
MSAPVQKLASVLLKREREIVDGWIASQTTDRRVSAADRQGIANQAREFMDALKTAAQTENLSNISGTGWTRVREILSELSASRAKAGYTPTETASFIFSLKPAVLKAIGEEFANDAAKLADASVEATEVLDQLGIYTMEAFQKTREDIISRQQQELLELSTPVVRLWENVLALPLIGTLDSARTQIVMQNLLEAIVQTRSDFAIIDITGVPVVDTLVAQHLLKTVAAARLMGADCLISGIRPQIAQTIIHLGVDLTNVTTKATLADAFAVALKRSGHVVVKESTKTSTVK